MTKRIAAVLVGLYVLYLVFNLIPTGKPDDEVISAYMSTLQYQEATQGGLQSQYFALMEGLANGTLNINDPAVLQIANAICEYAIYIAKTIGDGERPLRKQGQFYYSTTNTSSYENYTTLHSNVLRMKDNQSVTCNISCVSFATYCWRSFLQHDSVYQTSCSNAAGSTVYGKLLQGDGTVQWVWENAKPGDLIFYSRDTNPLRWTSAQDGYKEGAWTHVELYIGEYTCDDGTVWQYANASSNQASPGCNVDIHELTTGSINGRSVYVVHLADWMQEMASDYQYTLDYQEVNDNIVVDSEPDGDEE